MKGSLSSFKVDRYWQIGKSHWIPALAAFLAISTWGIVTTAMKANIYEAEAKLKLKENNLNSFVTDTTQENIIAFFAERNSPVHTEIEIISSRPIVQKTIDDLDLRNEENRRLKNQYFLDNLEVTVVPNTDVLKVTYQHRNPIVAAKIVNTLVNNYINSNITAKKTEALEAKQFLEQQLFEVQKKLSETEASINNIEADRNILSSSKEPSNLNLNIGDIQRSITEIRSQITNSNRQSEYIRKKLNMSAQQALNAAMVSQSPVVEKIVSQLEQLKLELQEKSIFAKQDAEIADIKQKIKLQEQSLANKIKSIISSNQKPEQVNTQFSRIQQELALNLIQLEATSMGLSKQLDYLLEIEQDLKNQAAIVPEIQGNSKQLERQLEASQRTYDLLQDRLNMIDVAANQNIGNVRVIAYAIRPETPITSRKTGYVLAISLGAIAAGVIICLLDYEDSSLRTVKKAKQLFDYNLLGLIPNYESQLPTLPNSENLMKMPLLVRDSPGSSVSESYRMLQSNLRSLSNNRDVQSIVITSSTTKEGKSTVAANLAGAMAQVGHKVLLVDANLHSPAQQQIWNTYSDYGLKNLLADNLDFRLATEKVMKNLSIVTSGGISASPSTLLDSYKMKDLIDYWSRVYDFVIIDAPSLDIAADAPILGKMADGIVLIVKPDKVDRHQADFARETIESSRQNVLGVVFNSIDPKLDASAHYYNSFKNQQNVLPEAKLAVNMEEGFWDSILRISQESSKFQLSPTTNPQQLLETPVDTLEKTVDRLEQDLEKLTSLVREQEDELFVKRQIIRKLQRKVNLASINDRTSLEKELLEEQENKQMLDKTLIGQRRNLARKKQILRQYQDILALKQT